VPNAPLAARTTMRVGGAAEWLLEPADPEQLREAVEAARAEGIEPRILGGGANLIIEDGVLPGVVITTDRMQRLFRPEPDREPGESMRMLEDPSPRHVALPREEGLRFVAWSGISLPKLVRSAAKLGWSGLQGLAGVPGNVGGGVAMNAGGSWGDMWDVVERLLVVDENAQLIELTREQCQPGYRNARLGGRIVASALLRFELSEPRTVEEGVREYLQKKNAVQPVTLWSAGCVWKNPDKNLSGGRSAGQLVEQAGGKGRSVGGAVVSEKHGNFVVNTGTASAADVLRLIGETERLVADKTGIQLEREVKVWRSGIAGA